MFRRDPSHEQYIWIRRYTSWEQVAGYFDGDGNVGVEVVKYVLKFKL